ncbi:hypothetical protein ACVW0I_005592 [Bradyrhizobium sp. LM6.11]
MRLLDRIAHAGLGREMHDFGKSVSRKQRRDGLAVGEIGLDEGETGIPAQQRKARLFQRRVVIAVEIVEPDDGPALAQKLPGDVKADETGRTRNQNRLIRHSVPEKSFAREASLAGSAIAPPPCMRLFMRTLNNRYCKIDAKTIPKRPNSAPRVGWFQIPLFTRAKCAESCCRRPRS